jgi:hypothetical protein
MMRELDFTCNKDNYFFGHMIQALQLSEAECLKIVHNLLYNSTIFSTVNEFREYELIRTRCQDFAGCKTQEDKMNAVLAAYHFTSIEEAQQYMAKQSVDYKLLFTGEYKKKNNSSIIVNEILNYWFNKIKSIDFMNTLAGENGFDPIVMSNFVDNIITCVNVLNISSELEQLIAEYVNVMNVSNINELMVADILASTISEFVTDLGFSRLSQHQKDNAKRIAQEFNLPIFNYVGRDRKMSYTEEELTKLFDDMICNPKAITSSFENNYYSWVEYMIISHIVHLQVPEYDIEENSKLSVMLDKLM